MADWRTTPYTRAGVTGLNGRCVAQLNALQNLPEETPMLSQAQWVAKRAREYAAVDTGYMRGHTVAKKTGPNTAQVNSTAPYAEFQEFGTRKMAAQPFLRPALADAAMELPELSTKEINRDIRRRVSRA
jgi:HK97 gp10 family phage protein